MTGEMSVRALFQHVGGLDHLLVTATPSGGRGKFLDQSLTEADALIRGKFFGSWLCARVAAPIMRPGGSNTFLTGAASIRPAIGNTMVTATFAALEALSRALAVELGPPRVNTIRPGVIDSDMWNFLDDEAPQRLREQANLPSAPNRFCRRCGSSGRVSDDLMTNPYVTGTVLLEVTAVRSLIEVVRREFRQREALGPRRPG